MARRRGQQKGYLHVQTNDWYLAYREDVLDASGKLLRVRRKVRLGSAKEYSKREARRLADEVLAHANQLALQPWSLITVEEFIVRRFVPDVLWTLKHSGKQHYSYLFQKHLIPALGQLSLRDVDNDRIQDLVRTKIEAGYSVQTALHIRNAVSAVFRHAKLKRFYFGENPAVGVRMPELVRTREPRALTIDQARQLVLRLPSPAREMALVSMTASLNVAEMLGLRWKHINLSEEPAVAGNEVIYPRSLLVRENCYRGHRGTVKTKSRRRAVPLAAVVVEALRGLRAQSEFTAPDDPVFSSETGSPLDERNLMQRSIKPAAKKLGLEWVGWHTFRHTHATLGEWIGMALSDRQAQMGHADPRMTLHYTHSDLDRRRTSIDQMAGLLVAEPAAGLQ